MEINNINPIELQPETNLGIKPEVNPPKNPSKKFLTIILIVLVLLLISSVSVAAYFYQVIKTKSFTTITPTPTLTNNSSETPFGSITWLSQPQKISPLTILNKTSDVDTESPEGTIFFTKINYYLVANFSDGSQLIDLFIPKGSSVEESSYSLIYRLVKSLDGKISILNSDDIYQIKDYLLPEISIIDLTIKELTPPEKITVNNNFFIKTYIDSKTFDTLSNPKLIGAMEFGDLYVAYTPKKDINDIYIQSFYLKLKDWTLYHYNSNYDFINDDRTTKIQWTDNSNIADQFEPKLFFDGCGSIVNGVDIIKNDSQLLDNKVAIASYNQKTIYQLKDANNAVVKNLYNSYKSSHEYNKSTNLLSLDDFINIKNHFLYQDSLGDWVIFVNKSYTVQAECGKPVIYLYPPKDTQISIRVGAKITKSEPIYPKNGWTVLAHPSGQLDYQNQRYNSLFWEGLGSGAYPNYRNIGTVVSQKELIPTIKNQLTQLGLNSKESVDFINFWQSKLPTTPFIRLTWLGTRDMDILAPLSVDPVPDTKIRIFLEFEGLQKHINLVPQKLSAPNRKGFTLIEWGGLLRVEN